MPEFDQLWIYLLAIFVAGVGLGVFLTRFLSDRYAHVNEVRWKRRFSEVQAEHELSIGKLGKTLRHAQEKQENLRRALDESDETVKLLTANSAPTFEQDVVERNVRIADLEKKLSRARAKTADAEDHEATLQKQLDDTRAELSRERENSHALQQKIAQTPSVNDGAEHGIARVISIHQHSADLNGHNPASKQHDDTELQIRTLQRELDEWKRKYEAANNGKDRNATERPVANSEWHKRPDGNAPPRDDLKLIRGIGPVLETALNELGFFQFEQLAAMDQPEIEQMARHDSSLPGRMRRYKWAEQARKLQNTQPDRHGPRA